MTAAKPNKRRTQEERRKKTRAAIMDAAVEILDTEGYAGFSSSAVAARAGVSRGALEHYYPKRNDLVAAACTHALNASVAETRDFAADTQVTRDPIGNFLAASERFFFAPGYRAQIEIMIAARAEPDLAEIVYPVIIAARRDLDGIWTETLAGFGYSHDQAERFVELSHFLLRGVFVADTWLPYEIDRKQAVAAWKALAPDILGRTPVTAEHLLRTTEHYARAGDTSD